MFVNNFCHSNAEPMEQRNILFKEQISCEHILYDKQVVPFFNSPITLTGAFLFFRYLFNCGENTVRILHELNRLKMNVTRVFLTGMTWQNHIAGLPTLIKCHGSLKGTGLTVYGPQGLTKFLRDVTTFSSTGLQRLQSLELFNSLEFIGNSDQGQLEPYVDDNVTIRPVVLERKDKDTCHSERQSVCYICEFEDLPGHFIREKAEKLGVTREWFNELAIGHPVVTSQGRKVSWSTVNVLLLLLEGGGVLEEL